MKILLAGGCGYVGAQLCPALLDRGYEVDVVDTCWFGVPKSVSNRVNVRKQNLFSLNESDLKGYDQVLMLAGLSNDPQAEFSPRDNFILNNGLPSYISYIARRAGVKRLILSSSCSVYGYAVGKPYDEDGVVNCDYPYGIAKLQGERGCLQLVNDDFSVIALRKGTISGYSSRMRFDLIVNAMFKNACLDNKITVNNPSLWRPILDMRDAVSAYIRAVQADLSISGVFNVAGGNYTVGTVGDLVKERLEDYRRERFKKDGSSFDTVKLDIKNIHDLRNYKVTCEKAKDILGFVPQYGIKDTVSDLFNHLSEYGNMNDEKYYNIKVFEKLIASGEPMIGGKQ